MLLGLLVACAEPEQPPSILLITLDTTRADRLGCYGRRDAGTPHLDALAARGVRFDRAYTSAPITLPAHASILTGTEPARHGVRDNGSFDLDASVPTLATRLGESGYQTAAFVSAYPVVATFGLDRGFDLYDDDLPEQESATGTVIGERRAADTLEKARAWIDQRPADRPWFAWVHLFDPHSPYAPPTEWAERWRHDPYQGELAYVDHCLGELFDRLGRDDRLYRVLVAVVADHGESLGEHGEDTHAFLLHDATLRVPWLLAGPGIPAGRTITPVVRTVDLVPTLLDYAGLASLPGVSGRTTRHLIDGDATEPPRPAELETWYPRLRRGWSELVGRVEGSTKVVWAPSSSTPPEAYDLSRDPFERQSTDARLGAALPILERLQRSTALRSPSSTDPPLDPEVERQLTQLGYLSTGGITAASDRPHPRERLPVLRGLAEVQRLIGAQQLERASALLDRLEAMAPDELGIDLNRGRVHRAQGESDPSALERAAAAFGRVIQKNPRHRHAWWALAEVESLRGRSEAAAAARLAAERLGPTSDR